MVDPYQIELDAFALYKAFMRGNPRKQLRHWKREGAPGVFIGGQPVFETEYMAAKRRWDRLPEKTRIEFMREAGAG